MVDVIRRCAGEGSGGGKFTEYTTDHVRGANLHNLDFKILKVILLSKETVEPVWSGNRPRVYSAGVMRLV